jgi:hypothetical protein
MKKLVVAALMAISFVAAHSKQPTTDQIEQYLSVTKTKESVEAQVEGFSKQYAKTSSPKQLEEINLYLNSVMGWSALKDEYIKLVQETYSEEEIKASLNFMKSATGQSIARKNLLFSSKTSTLIAKRVQAFSQSASKAEGLDREDLSQSNEKLEAIDVERHQESDRTYFTGKVINKGNAAARSIQVEINLFLGSKFVDQYTTYISGVIPAGGERYFKVSCGCKDALPSRHDSFRALVVSAY